MKKLVIGILAHVDAGKTTLSESILYRSGLLRKPGRVDNGDAFLDTYALEKARGITIFSKQANFKWKSMEVSLLDTPGHVDFSAEMERSLQVLDAAVLVISGADGVQGHTQTLWQLLKRYGIPVFLFINKMDQPGTDKEAIQKELKDRLDEGCVDFSGEMDEAFYEQAAMCDEAALEQFLEEDRLEEEQLIQLIRERKLFPCFYGSALKLTGVDEFLDGLDRYTVQPVYPQEFGAKIFKIVRDDQGNRLTYMKITGGSLKVKSMLTNAGAEDKLRPGQEVWEEKVNQIRIYSGDKYELINEAQAGTVCAVTGLGHTRPGEGLGVEQASAAPLLEPVLTYQVKLPEGCEVPVILPRLRQLEEEEPALHIVWDERLQEIQAQVMGEVQIEILKSLIQDRFGVAVEFGAGHIVYKETIADRVEGVGHFEPLRHYAEVHLLLEPAERGSGLQFASDCSEDILDRNWQRLVLTHLEEKEHRGVLTGAPITDMKITLLTGRSHLKHTEGGDFRQATYRAVRQGLMQAHSILLEPWYAFRLEVPEKLVGRAMTDIEKMNGSFNAPFTEGDMAVLTGVCPVVTMRDYQKEVIAYTKGYGRLFCSLKGYEPCHNALEVMEQSGYDPERDTENPTGSVFCAHGAGFVVPWDKVTDYMHLECRRFDDLLPGQEGADGSDGVFGTDSPGGERSGDGNGNAEGNPGGIKRADAGKKGNAAAGEWIDVEEIDEILSRTFHANKRNKELPRKDGWNRFGHKTAVPSRETVYTGSRKDGAPREKYLLVDGYNIIFAWEELKSLAEANIDGARGRLQDILCNYQGMVHSQVIVVFDAYRVQGHTTEVLDYHNIHVVYTREAETADQYIEKFTHENGKKYDITVATSDGLEQVIIRGQGCRLLSARDLQEDIELAAARLRGEYLEQQKTEKSYLLDSMSEEVRRQISACQQMETIQEDE